MPPETNPAPARAPNPNRDLAATEVVALFRRKLPRAMLAGLAADREWLWWSGPKPDEQTRTALVEIGFEFTPRDHAVTLRDGSSAIAHWFHSCGGYVKRGRGGKKGGPITKPAAQKPDVPSPSKPAPAPSQRRDALPARDPQSDAVSSFLDFAKSL